jgi:NAD(P)-dependent dehydrogenase (short-subunit alcohol dehydrogenase family)
MPGEKVILILGAQTYLGKVAAETLAGDGNAVYACVPDLCGSHQAQARSLIESAFARHLDLHVLAFDLPAETHFAPIIRQGAHGTRASRHPH